VRQIVLPRHGGPEVLVLREAPDPTPYADEVRIAVEAIGVNFADVLARQGFYPDAPSLPAVIGYEVAGVIDRVGEGVAQQRVGERVLALARFGGYSSSVIVPSAHALPIPGRLTTVEAAVIPVNYLTAFVALYKIANVASGETTLVYGAGGGVGVAAIQLARLRNAAIIGTASAAKHDAIRQLGVENVLDPSQTNVADEVRRLTGNRGVDVVLDPIGGQHFRKSYQLLAPLGRLVLFGASSVINERNSWARAAFTMMTMPAFKSMQLINDNRGVFGLNLGRLWSEHGRIAQMMAEILLQFEAGHLQPVISRVFPMENAADAHRFLQSRANFGKVILTTSPESSLNGVAAASQKS